MFVLYYLYQGMYNKYLFIFLFIYANFCYYFREDLREVDRVQKFHNHPIPL